MKTTTPQSYLNRIALTRSALVVCRRRIRHAEDDAESLKWCLVLIKLQKDLEALREETVVLDCNQTGEGA